MNSPVKVAVMLAVFALASSCVQAVATENAHQELESVCPGMARYQASHPHPDSTAPIADAPGVSNQALRRNLLEMYARDEAAGAAYRQEVDKDVPDPEVVRRLSDVRAENLLAIKVIVGSRGFPMSDQVGDDGVWAAYTLVLHADGDHAFQSALVPQLETLFKAKKIPGQVYAYLLDRTLVAEGKPQVYGTQFHSVGQDLEIRPLENVQAVDAKRQEADLPSMSDYLCYVRVRSGKSIRLPVTQ
ncbi:DUF6624 domain-containing protein [Lysobacter rhizosphaerae]